MTANPPRPTFATGTTALTYRIGAIVLALLLIIVMIVLSGESPTAVWAHSSAARLAHPTSLGVW